MTGQHPFTNGPSAVYLFEHELVWKSVFAIFLDLVGNRSTHPPLAVVLSADQTVDALAPVHMSKSH